MIGWFLAKPSQLNKYCKLYTDQGMDVLVGSPTFLQSLFTFKDIEVSLSFFKFVEQLILIYLQNFGKQINELVVINEKQYPKLFVHSFSGGAPMWGVVMRMIKKV